jgi:hypothetical protein
MKNTCYVYAGHGATPYVEDCNVINEPIATVTYPYEGEYSGDVVIPDEVVYNNKTYRVTTIEDDVFAYYPITSLSVTNNITTGTNLYGCSDLKALKAHAEFINNTNGLWDIKINELYYTGGYVDYIDRIPSLEVIDLSDADNTILWQGLFLPYYEGAYSGFDNLRELVLPKGLMYIENRQFQDLWLLEGIVIPKGITEIPDGAFYNCHALREVTFNDNLTSIGNYAFYNCHALESIVIPEGVTEIGNAAFYGCTYLENIELPSTLNEIGNNAFALCSKVRKIKTKAHTPPALWAKTFYEVDRNIPVYVAELAYDNYVNDQYWGEFFNIIPAPEYNDEPTNIENTNLNSVMIYTQGGMLYVEGIETDYNVFDASGRLIYNGRDAVMSLPRGVYMLSVGDKTYKVAM